MFSTEAGVLNPNSLYARLGGAPAIAEAVEQFCIRVLSDPLLLTLFDQRDMKRMRKQQRDFFTTALGGPATYQGRHRKRAPARFCLGEKHFARFARHLSASFEAFGVPPPTIAEVMAAVEPLATDIINTPTTPQP